MVTVHMMDSKQFADMCAPSASTKHLDFDMDYKDNSYAEVVADMLAWLNEQIIVSEVYDEGVDADTDIWETARHDTLEEVERLLLDKLNLIG